MLLIAQRSLEKANRNVVTSREQEIAFAWLPVNGRLTLPSVSAEPVFMGAAYSSATPHQPVQPEDRNR